MKQRTRTGALLMALVSSGCVKTAPTPAFEPLVESRAEAESRADVVEQVIFMVGDAGDALPDDSPLLIRMGQDAERWSAALAREQAVSVLFLGDNVYPAGVRDPGDPLRPTDSLHLKSQIDVVSGPNFRRYRNRAFFIAGNHDWGNRYGLEGLARIGNEQKMLDEYAKAGIRVGLYPTAGQPGPTLVDAGDNVRFVFLDTHWWLQADHEDILRDTVFFNVNQILRASGDRAVVFVSHHPFASGGAHGGPVPIWKGFGILWLLRQTGSLVQDLNSPAYRELQDGLQKLFKEIRRPLIYIGGHDHSLQVIERDDPEAPQWTLVSGSGSKRTDVGDGIGMRFGTDRPGFMRLDFRRDGAVELHVFAAPIEYQLCGDDQAEDVAACMRDGPGKYEEAYASLLRQPHDTTPPADTTQGR